LLFVVRNVDGVSLPLVTEISGVLDLPEDDLIPVWLVKDSDISVYWLFDESGIGPDTEEVGWNWASLVWDVYADNTVPVWLNCCVDTTLVRPLDAETIEEITVCDSEDEYKVFGVCPLVFLPGCEEKTPVLLGDAIIFEDISWPVVFCPVWLPSIEDRIAVRLLDANKVDDIIVWAQDGEYCEFVFSEPVMVKDSLCCDLEDWLIGLCWVVVCPSELDCG
jgi:hypothetical protein